MPDLKTSLQGRDLGHLRIVAERWGLDFQAPDAHVGLARLTTLLLDPHLLEEIVAALPEQARQALDDLLQQAGRIAWSQFTRQYGELREIGPGKRDRERPDLNPLSATERLWYRALIGRGFMDTPDGPVEFAYLPDDLAMLLPPVSPSRRQPLGRPASPDERAQPVPATDWILDDLCSLLAGLRGGMSLEQIESGLLRARHPLALQAIAHAAGLITADGALQPEPARAFLEAPRPQALLTVWQAWLNNPLVNDLRLIPGLAFDGGWQNDPVIARRNLITLLGNLPANSWWSLTSFIAAVGAQEPDVQRSRGEYDTWYIRRVQDAPDAYLLGFSHWMDVDGLLLRYLISGPLHWLGFVDLASGSEQSEPRAFRRSAWAQALLEGQPPAIPTPEAEPVVVRSNAEIGVPRRSAASARYQIARAAEWVSANPDLYRYRLTPASLEQARRHGLTIDHLIGVLRRVSPGLPTNLTRALKAWDQRGVEARLQEAWVLRLANPEILQALRNSRAKRFLGDPLGPASVLVNTGAAERVLAVLAELGYLGEIIPAEDPGE